MAAPRGLSLRPQPTLPIVNDLLIIGRSIQAYTSNAGEKNGIPVRKPPALSIRVVGGIGDKARRWRTRAGLYVSLVLVCFDPDGLV